MLLREMSDLHLEICPFYVPPMKGDEDTVMLLNGDICTAHRLGDNVRMFFESLRRFKAVIYIPGNHEYYNEHIDLGDAKIKAWLIENEFNNVYFLNKDSIIIDDVAFIGATLWTDINHGNPLSKIQVENGLNDYHVIKAAGYRKLRANDTILKHTQHREYLFNEIKNMKSKARITVALTHHAPSELSVHPKYRGNNLNPAYFSNLDNEILDSGPDLYFHGHCHDNFEYKIGDTKVICNPRGYCNILRMSDFNDMLNMHPIDMDNPDDGAIMAKFQNIWYPENVLFDPFYRIEI